MTDTDVSLQKDRVSGFGRTLRMILFYAVLIALPLGIYFVFYVDTRVEQTTVRNFRALDAASVRLTKVIGNLHQIASNVPVGVQHEDFEKILDESAREVVELDPGREKSLLREKAQIEAEINKLRSRERQLKELGNELRKEESRAKMAQQSIPAFFSKRDAYSSSKGRANIAQEIKELELRRFRRQSDLRSVLSQLKPLNCEGDPYYNVLDTVGSISKQYLQDFRAIASATSFEVRPLLLSGELDELVDPNAPDRAEQQSGSSTTEPEQALASASGASDPQANNIREEEATGRLCEDRISSGLYNRLREVSGACNSVEKSGGFDLDGVSRRLITDSGGIKVEARNCKPFSERSAQLVRALPDEQKSITSVLDKFGVAVIANIDSLVDGVAENVAPLFDQYLIADHTGRVLYNVDHDRFRYEGVTGAPSKRRARRDFVNHVNMKELVASSAQADLPELSRNLEQLGMGASAISLQPQLARYGIHSRVQDFQVGDITFQAFIHPFEVEGLVPLPTQEKDFASEHQSVLYMIGIVSRSELSSESIRLRLSLVANALLAIGGLFSALALLWLWTVGDRPMLTFRHLVLFCATGITTVVFYTLLALHLGTRVTDDLAFDTALEQVANNVSEDFGKEFRERMETLASTTALMLEAGESKARNPDTRALTLPVSSQDQDPKTDNQATVPATALNTDNSLELATQTPVKDTENNIKEFIDKGYFCRLDELTGKRLSWPPTDPGTRNPVFDLAFLMDPVGKQWQCLSYRLFDTRPLSLPFRKYFKYPRDRRLWHLPAQEAAGPALPGYYMDRITSILDGTIETVLAARPDDLCGYLEEKQGIEKCPANAQTDAVPSAAIIGRMHSLESTVLPPHVRFAVVDNQTGRTLFHSVHSRSLATNFVRETEADETLLALIDSATQGFVDLDYYGTSIRAFAQPLAPGLPWTLVTYRDHDLADTLGIMAVSAAAGLMVSTLLLLALAIILATLFYQRTLGRSWPWRTVLLSEASVKLTRRYLYALTATITVLLVFLWWQHRQLGGWLAVSAVIGVFLTLACLCWWHARRASVNMETGLASSQSFQDRVTTVRGPMAGVLAMVLISVGVLPTISWYMQVRAELSAGLGQYMRYSLINEVERKCLRQNEFARRYKPGTVDTEANRDGVFDYGWGLFPLYGADHDSQTERCAAYPGANKQRGFIENRLPANSLPEPRLGSEFLRKISAFSGLASDLAARNAYAKPVKELATPGDILDAILGKDPRQSQAALGAAALSTILIAALLGIWLLWVVVISITDRVLGLRVRLGLLPATSIDRLPAAWHVDSPPLRAVVVHRSERSWESLIEALRNSGHQSPHLARYTDNGIVWEPIPDRSRDNSSMPPESGDLYVVPGLERFIVDAAACEQLLTELERLSSRQIGIVIFSRILPGHWIATLTDHASGDLANVTRQLTFTSRWSQVLGPFEVRRMVHVQDEIKKKFDAALASTDNLTISSGQYKEVRLAMLREARANPELVELAASIVNSIATTEHPENCRLMRIALQRFGAVAASYFHSIWAASGREERLQLLALARGGFANPTQAATLASLANRGLIAIDGIIRLRSEAFARFIVTDLEHDALLLWRDQGHGNIWRSIWPPIILIVILAVAFFVSSTPEALAPLAAIMVASLGAVPVISSLMRGFQDLRRMPSQE